MTTALLVSFVLIQKTILLWPPPGSLVGTESAPVILWVGQGDENAALSVNGGSLSRRQRRLGGRYGRYLHAFVPLRPGTNTVSVSGPSGVQRISIFRYDRLYPIGTGLNFSHYTYHSPSSERRCSPCHFGAAKTYCTDCHREAKKPRLHGPVASGRCTLCHRPSPRAEKARFTPIMSPNSLCLSCHQHTAQFILWKKYPHGPASSFQCILCHEPHSSWYPFMLKKEPNNLCTTCHSEKKTGRHILAGFLYGDSHPVSGWDDPLEEGERLNCASCHNPHASHAPDLRKFGEAHRFYFCQRCHNK